MNPNHPVYVISKGRWKRRQTVKSLEYIQVPYRIVIEPQEYEEYAKVVDPKNILVLPFSNLGQGSIPARNWVWEHSMSEGHEKHWIMDDNLEGFWRYNRNHKTKVSSGTCLKIAEDFVDRYENVAISGLNYTHFCPASENRPPIRFNTRIYSCLLIRNDIPYRWRGRYNEDTDLSLRVLKDGWCTILFNAFLIGKRCTMVQSGGNTDELYAGDGRLQMAESLRDQHPDVTRVIKRYGRWQHLVDYKPFEGNLLKFKEGVDVPDQVNNFGMWRNEEK